MTSSRRERAVGRVRSRPRAALASRTAAAAEATGGARSPQPLAPNPPPPAITAPSAVAKLACVELGYWDSGGNGPAVVLLHPATGSRLVWGYQQAAFAAAGYRVIGYSRRGFNGSSPVDATRIPARARTTCGYCSIICASIARTWWAQPQVASSPLRSRSRGRSGCAALTLACTILSGAERTVMDMVPSLREPWYNALPHEFRELSPSYRAIDAAGVQRWHELNAQSRGNNPAANQPAGEPATLASIARLTHAGAAHLR